MAFFETIMGHRFYEHTMPTIANKLGVIADALTTLAANSKPSSVEETLSPCARKCCECRKANAEFNEEFIGQLVDICEDAVDALTGDGSAHFAGEAYDNLANRFREALKSWGAALPAAEENLLKEEPNPEA